jgi:hypothetical protein
MADHFQDEVGSDRSDEAIISRCSGDHFNMIHGSFLLVRPILFRTQERPFPESAAGISI